MRIFRYLKPYWFIALLAPIFITGEVICDLVQPQYMSAIIDDGVLGGSVSLIPALGLKMLVFVVLGGICGVLSGVFASAAANSFADDLRRDAYAKIMTLSFSQTDDFTTASLVTRVTNDVTQVTNLVSVVIRMLVRTGILFVGGIVMMIRLSPSFSKALWIILPVEIVLMVIFLLIATPYFKKLQTKLDTMNAIMEENVNGARVVKAYTQEKTEMSRFAEANESLSRTNLKVSELLALLSPLMSLLLNATVIGIIYIGGLEVEAGSLQVGSVMAAVTYVGQILMGIMMVAMMSQMLSRAVASVRRLNAVLDTRPVITSGSFTSADVSDEEKGEIAFHDVSFSYRAQGGAIIDHVSLTVKPGETIALLGATGSGKSSLVNLIPRFYDVTDGTVSVDGKDVRDWDLKSLRSAVTMVLQKTELFSGTIKDNILWGKPDATDEEIREAARIAQADDFIMGLPRGYDSYVGEAGMSLSGGQKQRVAIARALLRKPEILVFDDSTSALDLITEANLHKALKEKLENATVIIIAQRVASAKAADRIAVLDDGHLASVGTHEELMESSPIYQDIYNSQLKKGGVLE